MWQEEQTIPIALTTQEQYQQIVKKLAQRTVYIVLVQICEEADVSPVLAFAQSSMKLIGRKKVRKWLGTVRGGSRATQFIFQGEKRFFKFLLTFPSFFFNSKDQWGCDLVVDTAFGEYGDDIAFLDQQERVLFFTTTHEGYAYMRPDLLDEP